VRLVLIYAGLENGQGGWPDDRSLAMQRLAGTNMLGHFLNQVHDLPLQELVLVLEKDQAAISEWCAAHLPQVERRILTVAPGLTPWQALDRLPNLIDESPLLLAYGDRIIEADFHRALGADAPAIVFTTSAGDSTPPEDTAAISLPSGASWAGACYFKRGSDLLAALPSASGPLPVAGSVFENLYRLSPAPLELPSTLCLPVNSVEGILYANARLLGLGYGSDDAIERSYVEDFTVIPPVFLHETAIVEYAVVGPFVNIEAGAHIKHSVVRNSLIGREALVSDAVLAGSLIGDGANVQARAGAVIVDSGDEANL
jgi:glucose-1-phosphate thymidylyltransferase